MAAWAEQRLQQAAACHGMPAAAPACEVGGPIALVKDGDDITIDAETRVMQVGALAAGRAAVIATGKTTASPRSPEPPGL